METGTILLLVTPLILFVIFKTLYDAGKKALSIFPDIKSVHVVYRDATATGYSKQSWKTKFAGASRAIDIVVTEQELWLKSIVLFANVTKQHGLLHRVQLRKVLRAKPDGDYITIDFKNERGEAKQVVIRTRNNTEFIKAIGK
jgi:hypothetical protein